MSPDNTHDVFQRAGLAHRLGISLAQALVVVDMQIGFTDPEQSPLAASLDQEIIAINRLIAAARSDARSPSSSP